MCMESSGGQQHESDNVLHESAHDANISEELDENLDTKLGATSDHAAIADLASPSASYVQAEAVAARDKINEILDVLRDSGLIPSA